MDWWIGRRGRENIRQVVGDFWTRIEIDGLPFLLNKSAEYIYNIYDIALGKSIITINLLFISFIYSSVITLITIFIYFGYFYKEDIGIWFAVPFLVTILISSSIIISRLTYYATTKIRNARETIAFLLVVFAFFLSSIVTMMSVGFLMAYLFENSSVAIRNSFYSNHRIDALIDIGIIPTLMIFGYWPAILAPIVALITAFLYLFRIVLEPTTKRILFLLYESKRGVISVVSTAFAVIAKLLQEYLELGQ